MDSTIFLINSDEQLIELREQAYDSEDLLQRLLASYPNLLAGVNRSDGLPQTLLLIGREARIPGEEGGTGRWAVDHLFIDRDAVPTLVEVKCGSDPRIRREVVGQMLDYAANAVVYWPVEHLKVRFEATCNDRRLDPEHELAAFLGSDDHIHSFWQQVKTNLQAGKVRLVFAADVIPPELRRIVEFLNEQMDPAEVLAVEIKQFTGEGLRTLVPVVIGQTAEAQQRKGKASGATGYWNEPKFFQHLAAKCSDVEVSVARRILDWATPLVDEIWWGTGLVDGSFVPVFTHDGIRHQMFAAWTNGVFAIYFYWYARKPPFDDESKRRELLDRLNSIPGVSLPPDAINRRPTIRLSTFQEEVPMQMLFETFQWYIETIRGL